MKKRKPSVKHPSTENKDNFRFIWLGQTILKYQVPLDIFNVLNGIYETNFVNLPDAHKQLVGKIGKENSLFFGGTDNNKMHRHNLLPPYVLKWFESKFRHYLEFNKIHEYELKMQSIWINEMKAGEYNPIHIHQGTIYTGLSSVMILHLPKDMGPEYAREDVPTNGKLQIIVNGLQYNDSIVGKNMHTIRTEKVMKVENEYLNKIPERFVKEYGHIRF